MTYSFTCRLKHMKGNLLDFKQKSGVQKLVESTKLVKSFLSTKLKKPPTPKPDYNPSHRGRAITIQHIDADMRSHTIASTSSLSMEDPHSSDSQSDVNSVSSHGSHSAVNLVPRPRCPEARVRTQSAGALLEAPPPLPPRNTRSQYL